MVQTSPHGQGDTVSKTNTTYDPDEDGQVEEVDLSGFIDGDLVDNNALKLYDYATGEIVLARIPTMDDAHIPDVETLSYTNRFAGAQIPWGSIDADIVDGVNATTVYNTTTALLNNAVVPWGSVSSTVDLGGNDLQTLAKYSDDLNAPADSLYYDTTDAAVEYKDSGGTIHTLG